MHQIRYRDRRTRAQRASFRSIGVAIAVEPSRTMLLLYICIVDLNQSRGRRMVYVSVCSGYGALFGLG